MPKPEKPVYAVFGDGSYSVGEGAPDNVEKLTDLLFVIGEANDFAGALRLGRMVPTINKEKLAPMLETADRNAKLVKDICTRNPTAPITLSIYGYDNDPREIWQIPEAVLYIGMFGAVLHTLGYPPNFKQRLTPESIKWVDPPTHEAPDRSQ